MAKIVIASPHCWRGSLRLSAHHYAEAGCRNGDEVLFVSGPVCPTHMLGFWQPHISERLLDFTFRVRRPHANLSVLTPFSILPVHQRAPFNKTFFMKYWYKATLPGLVRSIRQMGFSRPDGLILDHPMFNELISELKPEKSAIRILDHLDGFSQTPDSVLTLLSASLSKANTIIVAADTLKSDVYQRGGHKALAIPHGVDITHFPSQAPQIPDELANIPTPRLLYVGAISDWFDLGTLRAAALLRPKWQFVLIGPVSVDLDPIYSLPNVHILGHCTYEKLAAYMHHSQLGIIPFERNKFKALTDHIHPLKIYEYMACNLRVVAVKTPEIELIPGDHYLYSDGDFVETVDRALREPPAMTAPNLIEAMSWDSRYQTLRAELLGKNN